VESGRDSVPSTRLEEQNLVSSKLTNRSSRVSRCLLESCSHGRRLLEVWQVHIHQQEERLLRQVGYDQVLAVASSREQVEKDSNLLGQLLDSQNFSSSRRSKTSQHQACSQRSLQARVQRHRAHLGQAQVAVQTREPQEEARPTESDDG